MFGNLLPPGWSISDLAKIVIPPNSIPAVETEEPEKRYCVIGKVDDSDEWGMITIWRNSRAEAEEDLITQSQEGWYDLKVATADEFDDPAGKRAAELTNDDFPQRQYIAEDVYPAFEGDPANCAFNRPASGCPMDRVKTWGIALYSPDDRSISFNNLYQSKRYETRAAAAKFCDEESRLQSVLGRRWGYIPVVKDLK